VASGVLTTRLGSLALRSPLIAASGTVGSVWEWAGVADVTVFGAAVAKSVAPEPWAGREPPRLAPLATGMMNGIGIQNPGIEAWVTDVAPRLPGLGIPVWGSAVGGTAQGFATVARHLGGAGVTAIEVNLSCPNLDDGEMFSYDPSRSATVIEAVASVTDLPIGAKLSPNTPDPGSVARSCLEAGATFLVLTNTALGYAIDPLTRRPRLSGGVGGYSGPGIKPLSLRVVHEVATAVPGAPIVGCGGISTGSDVVEYLLAGASAVAMGTVLLAEPRAGSRIVNELMGLLDDLGVGGVDQLVGAAVPW
jgi:dihydroorotate dehydrogenase (NAD+) catalytic subunit